MDFGAAGGAMIFFCLTALQVLVGLFVLAYTAHSLLLVLENTAAGNDEVLWPDEPYFEWLAKLAYVAWLVALAAVPTWLLLGAIRLPAPAARLLTVAVPFVLFPVELLSSMSASTRWIALRPLIVWRLLLRLPALLIVYVAGGVLLGGAAWLVHRAVFGAMPLLLPVAAVALAYSVLVYARLLGRLGWLINPPLPVEEEDEESPEGTEKGRAHDPWAPPEEEAPPPPRKAAPRRKPRTKAQDPWAVPEEPAPPEPARPDRYLTKEVYKVSDDAPPAPQPAPPRPREKVEGYGVLPAPETPKAAEPSKPVVPPETERVSRYEAALAAPRVLPPPPPFPLLSGVYSFPFYDGSLGPLSKLAVGYLVMGIILCGQLATMPR